MATEGDMPVNKRCGLIVVLLFFWTMVANAAEPLYFKTTYHEFFSEFPNFEQELKDAVPQTEGNARRAGSVRLGQGLVLFDAEGRTLDKIDTYGLGMVLAAGMPSGDITRIERVTNEFIKKLARSQKGYARLKGFINEQVDRQLAVLAAGGTPESGARDFGKLRLTVSVQQTQGMTFFIYTFKFIA